MMLMMKRRKGRTASTNHEGWGVAVGAKLYLSTQKRIFAIVEKRKHWWRCCLMFIVIAVKT